MVIALEGMPGAGKTSCMVSIAQTFGASCLALSELNLTDQTRNPKVADLWRIYHHLWLERQDLVEEIRCQFPLILIDRSHFSTIGVEQAKVAASLKGAHVEVAKASRALKVSMYDAIILCESDMDLGLARRARAHEIPELWSDRAFLKELKAFYKTSLPYMYPGPLFCMDTTHMTPEQMSSAVSKMLLSFGIRPTSETILVDAAEARMLHDAGVKRHLGPAYGRAFQVLGCPTLYFRQHSLQLDGAQVRWFDTARVRQLALRR